MNKNDFGGIKIEYPKLESITSKIVEIEFYEFDLFDDPIGVNEVYNEQCNQSTKSNSF